MKNFILALAVLLGVNAEARAPYDVWHADASSNIPVWSKIDANSITGPVNSCTNIDGGLGGQIPYQSAAGVTALLANGTAGQLLQSNGTTLAPSWVNASGGTVTSVDLSMPAEFSVSGNPVTTSGTLTVTKASQLQNIFFASPDGSSGAPTFRSIVAADVPTLNQNTTGNATTATTATHLSGGLGGSIPYQTAANTTAMLANGTVGQVLTSNGTTLAPSWTTVGGLGTVTSVDMTVPAFLSVAGNPITTSGTLAVTLSGTALPVANGGTSLTTLTANNVILGNGTSAPTFVAPGSSGNVLTSNGTTWTSAAPSAASSLVRMTLSGATVPFVAIDGAHRETAARSITTAQVVMLNSGSSGSTVVRFNQYDSSGTLVDSETATLSANAGLPAGTAATITNSGLTTSIGDIITVDVDSVAGGTPSELTVEF